MNLYKKNENKLIKNRIGKHLDTIKTNDTTTISESDQTNNLENADPDFVSDIISQIAFSCYDTYNLLNILQQVIPLNNLELFSVIVNSPYIPNIMNTFRDNPSPPLIQAMRDLVYFSPILTYQLYQYNLIEILFDCIQSQNLQLSHEALQFIQKIIPYGVTNRAVLYGSFFFDLIFEFLQNSANNEEFQNAAYTVLLFVFFDPVYGENSYSKNGGKLPKRNIILNQCREIEFTDKAILNISSFLKHGVGNSANKAIYHIINLLLISNDEDLCFYAIQMIENLSHYCYENSVKIMESTEFLNFTRHYIDCDNNKIQISIFNTIRNIIFFTGNKYEKKIIKLNPFFYGLDLICNENTTAELKVAAGRCIFYGINYIDTIQNLFTNNALIYDNLLQVYDNSQMIVRAEVCCLIISIILKSSDSNRVNYLSDDLILSFLDYLNDYDEEQVIQILRLFLTLLTQFSDQMMNLLSNDETVETLTQLSSSENEEILGLSQTLIELITSPPEEEEDL